MNIPVESIEMSFPLRIPRAGLWADSGGAGRFRGGLGLVKVFEATDDRRHRLAPRRALRLEPWGLHGGAPARSARAFILRKDGAREELPSKKMIVLHPGDQLWEYIAGGAGHGDPLDRDAEAVLADVQDGKVSRESAREAYGVVLAGDGARGRRARHQGAPRGAPARARAPSTGSSTAAPTAATPERPRMKITGLETYFLAAPLAQPVRVSNSTIAQVSEVIVTLTTDAGLVGIGEAHGPFLSRPGPEGMRGVARSSQRITPLVVGRDPFNVEGIWQDLFALTYTSVRGIAPLTRQQRALVTAMSAVDIAVWDLMGKAIGRPVHALLGGALRERVPAYVTGFYYRDGERPDDLKREAAVYVEHGLPHAEGEGRGSAAGGRSRARAR